MRKRRTVLLCVIVAALALIALLAYNSTPAEPFYDGHPLSFWVLAQVTATYDADQDAKAKHAFNQIGPAALPFLVKWIQYEPPRWRMTVGNLLYRIPFITVRRFGDRITEPRAYRLAEATSYAFQILGKKAMPAFDDLCRLMNETNRPYTACAAAMALSCLGTNALPPLLTVVTNSHHPIQFQALASIYSGMPSARDVAPRLIPAITNCLGNANSPAVQRMVVSLIGDLKTIPETSIPALVSCLKSTNTGLQCDSAYALGQFGAQAGSAIPALTNALTYADKDLHDSVVGALHEIDPVTFTNTPPARIVE